MTYLQWMRENVGSTRSKRLYKSRKISRRFRKTFRKAENRRRFEASIAELVEDVNPVLADIRELSKLRSEAMLLAREICEAARATGDFRSKRYEYRVIPITCSIRYPASIAMASLTDTGQPAILAA